MSNKYDLVVIGAGPGGYVAAIKGAKAGLSVAVIEKRRAGGTCLNRGCIPAKAMIHASTLYREALEGERFGVTVSDAAFDYDKILAYKQETIDGLVGGVEQLLKANGVTVLEGTGTLLASEEGKRRVRISPASAGTPASGEGDPAACEANHSDENDGEQVVTAEHVILASGSKPAQIPLPGMDLPQVLDSDGLFALDHAPKSLLIIGGGVIGVEFATVFANLGTEVTIIEALPKLLDNFDKEISQNLKMILKKRGVEAHLNALVKECRAGDCSNNTRDPGSGAGSEEEGVCVVFEEKGKTQELSAEYVLVAAGRVPVTEQLFDESVQVIQGEAKETAGSADRDAAANAAADPDNNVIRMNGRFVAVDAHFKTSMPGVYAIGDLTGGIQLAHAASAHGIRVIEEITAGTAADCGSPAEEPRRAADPACPAFAQDICVIPAGVYTDPEIAQVGITEAQAKEQDIEVKTGKFIMTANGKSLITKEERGFIKVVADAGTGRILGAQMMCARATDMIGEFATAIVNHLTVDDMLRSVRPHPTYNEGIGEALEAVFGESLHTAPGRRR